MIKRSEPHQKCLKKKCPIRVRENPPSFKLQCSFFDYRATTTTKLQGYQAAEAVHILKIAQNDFKAELLQLKLTPIICLLLGLK